MESSGLPRVKAREQREIKPGDKVLCNLYPERGTALVTLVTGDDDPDHFLVWGYEGPMEGRTYGIFTIENLVKVIEEEK